MVTTDHPDLQAREVTVGKGRSGRVKVMIAVPDEAATGEYVLKASLNGWSRAAGGLGPRLDCEVKFTVVDEVDGSGSGGGKRGSGKGKEGPSTGPSVALKWSTPDRQEDWSRMTVGEVELVAASILAADPDSEYAELASLGDQEIPTVTLNDEYPRWKKYLESRSKTLTDLSRPREQYAQGVGVALLTLFEKSREMDGRGHPDATVVATAHEAAARAVLAVMPAFDDMIREAGLGGS